MNTSSELAFDGLCARIAGHLRETRPEVSEERIDHMAHTLVTARFEMRRRPPSAAVQRAWGVSLEQIGLTDEEARTILAKCS